MNMRSSLALDANCQPGLTTPLRLLLAPTAAFWMGAAQPPPATAAVVRNVTELRFREFFRSPVGPAGLEISDALRRADGELVRVFGYMVQYECPLHGRFMLTPLPVRVGDNADNDPDALPATTVVVYLHPGQKDLALPHMHDLLAASGRLDVGRKEERDGRVSWVRLQLESDASHFMNAVEFNGCHDRVPKRR